MALVLGIVLLLQSRRCYVPEAVHPARWDVTPKSQAQSSIFYSALGWLAREDKLDFQEQNGVVSLYVYQEKYY